jgi:hypothetical protein
MKIQNIFTAIILLVGALVYSMPVMAQPTTPDANAPIDGGLSLLVAAGVGYGAKKVRENRKNNKIPPADK